VQNLLSHPEERLRVSKNKKLKRTSESMTKDVTGSWTKLHNKGVHSLFSPPDINRTTQSTEIKWVWHVAHMETKNAYKVLA
jgi:hypothetical protein